MPYSSIDLCKIIKTARKAQLEELTYGDLHLSFRPKEKVKATLPGPEVEQVNTEESVLHDELRLRDTQIQDLILEDPSRYEEMLAGNELEPEGMEGAETNGQST